MAIGDFHTKVVESTSATGFQSDLNNCLNNPLYGYFVQEVQYSLAKGQYTLHYTALIIYSKIPTTNV